MPPVIAIIFWLWFAVSMVLLVQRRMKRAGQRRAEREARNTALRGLSPSEPEPQEQAISTASVQSAGSPESGPALAAHQDDSTSEPAEDFPAVTVPSDDGPRPSIRELMNPTRTSVAEIISGISMPCELVPLTGAVEDADLMSATRLVFCTSGHAAARVGAALADELERLGMTVASTDATTAMATNDTGCIELTIYGNPETVHAGNKPMFPTAPSDSVVVEIKAR